MKFIKKALWPTAIVAAVLMLFGALGSAINADSVKDSIETGKGGGVVYVEVDVRLEHCHVWRCGSRQGQTARSRRGLTDGGRCGY